MKKLMLFGLGVFAVSALARETKLDVDLLCKQTSREWVEVGLKRTDGENTVFIVLSEGGQRGLYRKILANKGEDFSDMLRKSTAYTDLQTGKRLRFRVSEYKKNDKFKRGIQAQIYMSSLYGDVEVMGLTCQKRAELKWDPAVRYGNRATSKDSKLILKTVEELGDLAHGVSAYRVEGKNIRQIVANFALDQDGEDEEREFDWDSKTGPESDGSAWGSMNHRVAVGVVGFVEKDGEIDEKASAKMQKVLERLQDVGTAAYTWRPSDYSYCGASFPSIAIVDLEAGIIYIVHQGLSGSC
ncbi:MAG: hypothetical protein AB7N80_11545 [Bdellovibrionales bacterium]